MYSFPDIPSTLTDFTEPMLHTWPLTHKNAEDMIPAAMRNPNSWPSIYQFVLTSHLTLFNKSFRKGYEYPWSKISLHLIIK